MSGGNGCVGVYDLSGEGEVNTPKAGGGGGGRFLEKSDPELALKDG